MSQRFRIYVLNIAGCLLFMAQPIIFPTHPRDETESLISASMIRDFFANELMLGFFYLNYFLLIPKLYFTRKYLLYSLCIIGGLLLITYFPSLITGRNLLDEALFQHNTVTPPESGTVVYHPTRIRAFLVEINHHIFLFVSIVSLSLLVKVRGRLLSTEKAKHNAEVSYLMSQINPHFLFNALNSIYTMTVKERASSASEAILKLSGMMRYIITETTIDLVSLAREISYINNYIELQKLRLVKSVQFSYECSGQFEHQQIAPLLLIPFIENAFKHGVNPDEESAIKIIITGQKNSVSLHVENNKVTSELASPEKTGIGIENTVNRLNLLYPEKHQLKITDTGKQYIVNLNITLND